MEIHAFSACAARLSDFLLRLSYRQCPIRPYGAPSPRGEGSVSGIAVSPYRSLPHWGRGTASAVDRVLSYIAYLRRSLSLSFIPSLSYPPLQDTFSAREGSASGIAASSYRSLPHWGRGTASAVDRVLSYIAYLRRSLSLSFIPSLSYPPLQDTFSAREGSASGIAASSYRSLPHWGRGTASAVDRVLSYIAYLRRFPSLSFIPLEPYPARFARHLPHAGKALCRGYPLLKRRRSRHLNPEP